MRFNFLFKPSNYRRHLVSCHIRRISGQSVQILKKEDDNSTSFTLDLPVVKQVFENPLIKDKPICIITVAGAMRTGKSFLLSQMLNHLSNEDVPKVNGFPWKGGMMRYTSGVHLWTDPFIVKGAEGEELAVFLMDTQGTFDHKTTVKENMTVFALSTMTSSHLMYNLMHVIREDHLQHLQLFTEYGRLALKSSGTTPFQKLHFLVRDWHYPHDAPFGSEGGQIVLDRLLNTTEEQPLEIRKLREHIISSFTDLDCFLFPYPGPKVAEDPTFTGSAEEMDPRFAKYINEFISQTLAIENLQPKRIAGKIVRSREMVDYFQKYLEIFNGDEIPEPKSIFDTTAEVTNLHALSEAKEKYIENMGALKQSAASQALVEVDLLTKHDQSMKESIEMFIEQSKFGGEAFAKHYQDELVKEILSKFDYFKNLNDSKIQNIFYKAKEDYLTNMEIRCGKEQPLHEQDLMDYHIKFAKEATKNFQRVNTSGVKQAFSDNLQERLIREIDERFVYYQNLNEAKIRVAVHRAQDDAIDHYTKVMDGVLEGPLAIHNIKLDYEHKSAKTTSMEQFINSSNFGTKFVTANERSLARDIEDKYSYFKELNGSKQFSKRLKATVEQLSDNETYKQFWSNPTQQKIVGGSVVSLLVIKILFGS
eukprot:GFUD01029254.1.p1 GENE.GFUD01029254.1~~GFUD01029254.1.p1  ORF type:complete len:647 (+),score=136.47 GFUD01029254.1:235-2175(+)